MTSDTHRDNIKTASNRFGKKNKIVFEGLTLDMVDVVVRVVLVVVQ